MATEAAATIKEAQKPTQPYLPFKTFLSALDTLKQGLPTQIDRSVFHSQSGIIQSQLVNAFRFLGLVTAEGKPTAELPKAIDDKERQAQIKKLLEKAYPNVFALGLATASPASLDAELRKSGLTGETHDKGKSFFLQAARFSGVQLSPYLQRVTRTSSGKRKRANAGAAKPSSTGIAEPAVQSSSGPSMKTVRLGNGINLFLGASADLFAMASEDRKFVMELLDKLEEYEQAHPAEDEPEEEEES